MLPSSPATFLLAQCQSNPLTLSLETDWCTRSRKETETVALRANTIPISRESVFYKLESPMLRHVYREYVNEFHNLIFTDTARAFDRGKETSLSVER